MGRADGFLSTDSVITESLVVVVDDEVIDIHNAENFNICGF